MIQPSDNQSYRQAQRAFTEARLRKDSGAAIPQSEFENDAKTYFPQPGDGPQQLKQKEEARKAVLESLRAASGRAFSRYYNEPIPTAKTAPIRAGSPKPSGASTAGVPAVGGMFNGQKVLKVEKVED